MWIDYLKSLSDDFEFQQPATEDALVKAEASLGFTLPADLRELLKETNGVEQRSAYLMFILPIERLEKENDEMRHHQALSFYMPLDHLLFFAEAGNGDLFGFPISRDASIREDVFVWNHENDSRCWCAPSLSVFIQWWHERKVKY